MITESDWRAIEEFVARMVSRVGEPFVQGRVLKVDTVRHVIFMKEFGDTPIPVVAFNHESKTRDTVYNGTVNQAQIRKNPTTVAMPKKGDLVLVAQHFGTSRLPKCLGIIQGKNFIVTGD